MTLWSEVSVEPPKEQLQGVCRVSGPEGRRQERQVELHRDETLAQGRLEKAPALHLIEGGPSIGITPAVIDIGLEGRHPISKIRHECIAKTCM